MGDWYNSPRGQQAMRRDMMLYGPQQQMGGSQPSGFSGNYGQYVSPGLQTAPQQSQVAPSQPTGFSGNYGQYVSPGLQMAPQYGAGQNPYMYGNYGFGQPQQQMGYGMPQFPFGGYGVQGGGGNALGGLMAQFPSGFGGPRRSGRGAYRAFGSQ